MVLSFLWFNLKIGFISIFWPIVILSRSEESLGVSEEGSFTAVRTFVQDDR